MLFFLEEDGDEFDDEDGADMYRHLDFDSDTDPLVPNVSDLPRFADVDPRVRNHNLVSYESSRMLVVVDINGVHDVPVTFCACENAGTRRHSTAATWLVPCIYPAARNCVYSPRPG